MVRRNLQHVSRTDAAEGRVQGRYCPCSRGRNSGVKGGDGAVHRDIKFFTEACLRPNNLRPPNILRGARRASFLHEAFIAGRTTSVVIRRRRKANRNSSSLKCAGCIIFRFFPTWSIHTRSTKRKSCNAALTA